MRAHGARHTIPEVGRGAVLPTHMREALGDWRGREVAVASKPEDERAVARAIEIARAAPTKQAAIKSLANRYASVEAGKHVADAARATCLLLARRAMMEWGEDVPPSTDEQIAYITSMVTPAPGGESGDDDDA